MENNKEELNKNSAEMEENQIEDVENVRARQFMVVQQTELLPYPYEELFLLLEQNGVSEWAYILHEGELSSKNDSTLVEPHVHVVLSFVHPQTIKRISKMLQVPNQQIQIWRGRINNAYSYLIHETETASGAKKKYDPTDVVASFDFPARIAKIRQSVNNADSGKALEQFAEGKISRRELRKALGTLTFARKLDTINKIQQVLDKKRHEEWLKEFDGHKMETIWIYGKAGAGKTRKALELAKESGKPYIILGSSNDYFQEYESDKHFVILDELRPNDLKYSDLLRILDPYQHDVYSPRRYHNSPLNIEVCVITTPYSPKAFYDKCNIVDEEIDTFEQLNRRISKIIEM